ncbi:hypothetical protein [Streptomyces sp. NBC_01422]|uniref:hypothetical protein n=1 Tax=Streptomyces sp. NBC_01422 TaxID=2903859 RepID=UPI002E2837F8|nr:hypothetical protein [Streptomyces sp. NBC_01422]
MLRCRRRRQGGRPAQWYWGGPLALAFFLAGILLPGRLDALLGIGGGAGTDPRNFAGSSGATYFLGATLALAFLAPPPVCPRRSPWAAGAPSLGLAMWLAQDNGHGLVSVYGFFLGGAVWAARRWAIRRCAARPAPGPTA